MNLNVLEILLLSAKILGVLLSRSEFLKLRSNTYTFFAVMGGMDSFPGACFATINKINYFCKIPSVTAKAKH